MSNTMRWRWGETNPVRAAVDSAREIEIGDLIWLDTDDVKPAEDQSDAGLESLNQAEFSSNFAGVAMQQSRNGDTDDIRVATTGVFAFECPSATFEVGDLVGIDEAAGGTKLENQQVVGVSTGDLAIGVVVQREATAVTEVLLAIGATVLGRIARHARTAEALDGDSQSAPEIRVGGTPHVTVNANNLEVGDASDSAANSLEIFDGGSEKPGRLVLYDHTGTDWHLWVDNSGDLRIHTGAPSDEDSDGTIVGTQS